VGDAGHESNANVVFEGALLQWDTDRASVEARLRAYFERASLRDGQKLPAA
jgi:hypothetical protein